MADKIDWDALADAFRVPYLLTPEEEELVTAGEVNEINRAILEIVAARARLARLLEGVRDKDEWRPWMRKVSRKGSEFSPRR